MRNYGPVQMASLSDAVGDDIVRDALDFDGEPSLDEMLDDPVIQAVMTQDGVARQEVVDLVASIQSAFGR